jgi:thiol:disulfide interchange protein DsbD
MLPVLWLLHLLLWLSISSTAAAIDPDDLLDADVAFALSAEAISREQIKLSWDIAEGYYLYRHSLKFASDDAGVSLGSADIPSGKAYQDEFFGAVETYRNALSVTVPVKVPTGASELTLQVSHQGCADLGVCYPPQRTLLSVPLPLAAQAGLAAAGADPLAELLAGAGRSSLPLLDEALPAAQAFTYEVIATDAMTLLVRMTPAPGYYLYRDKFQFSVPEAGVDVRLVNLPPGMPKYDEHFGDVQVYEQQVEIAVSLNRTDALLRSIHLVADFQGCKDAGICYPPMRRQVQLELPPLSLPDQALPQLPASGASLSTNSRDESLQSMVSNEPGSDNTSQLSEQDQLAATLTERPVFAMLLFFIAGLLLAFTPCVFPMVPILSGIIAGQGKDITTGKALLLSVVYVLAMAITYAVAGVIAGLSGENLQAAFQNPWIIGAFSGLFVLLALSMFGFYELQLPASLQSRLTSMSNRQHGGTLIGVAIMGLLSALIVGPCVAPALMAALIYIGQSGDAVLGGTALFAMALGMGVPLVIFGVSAGKILPGAGAWMNGVKAFFGVGLLALAIWMLERVVPGGIVMLLWGVLLIGSAVYLGALDQVAHGWPRLWKALGIVLLLFGGMQLLGFATGGDDWMRPLQSWRTSAGGAVAETRQLQFQRIKTVQDVQATLAQGRPVMLDFYADWCVECKRMEKTTFENAAVHQALAGVTLLQADVTANDAEDKALYQAYGLIGPPAILFFAADGKELRHRRVIGYLDSEDFLAHLQATFVDSK